MVALLISFQYNSIKAQPKGEGLALIKVRAEIQTTIRITARTIIHPTLPMAIRVKLGTAMRILAEMMTAEKTSLR